MIPTIPFAAFQSALAFEDRSTGRGGICLALTQDLRYVSLLQGPITVPAGFQTDLASIPRLLWNILPPIGAYDRAAVVHDFLYARGQGTRADADRVLFEAMAVCGVDSATCRVIYDGVRIGGWWAWSKHALARKAEA